jgi:hypothetical protein
VAAEHLHRLTKRLTTGELDALRRGGPLPSWVDDAVQPVTRNGNPIPLEPARALMSEFFDRHRGHDRPDRPATDAWLAPRLHWSLRLTRREASDRGVWSHLANAVFAEYVVWRWAGADGTVTENRFDGAVNKQALARLWWGAELFRDGPDYQPVEELFAFQDFPNSYLHRPFARNRPLALALLRSVDPAALRGMGGRAVSDFINDIAHNVNLWIAALSIESATHGWRPDGAAYLAWVREPLAPPFAFGALPQGPDDGRVPDAVAEAAEAVAGRVAELAKDNPRRRRGPGERDTEASD